MVASTLCENKKELKERLISIMKYKKKSRWVAIVTVLLTFMLTGCATVLGVADNISSTPKPTMETNSNSVSKHTEPDQKLTGSPTPGTYSSDQLKVALTSYTKKPILFFQSFHFGNHNAAFATVQGGEVWYINDSKALRLETGLSFSEDNPTDTTFLWTYDNITIFKCEDVPGGSSSISYAWYVKDGKPFPLANSGMNLTYLGNGQFITIEEAFDSVITDGTSAGHTYKPYYLYWEGDKLKEYGGIKITQQELLKQKGAKAILDVIKNSGYTIDDIYSRENNIININYHTGDKNNGRFDNVTLRYDKKTYVPILVSSSAGNSQTAHFNKSNLSKFSYGGIYKAALFPNIATYLQ